MNLFTEHYNHFAAILLLLAGLYIVIANSGLVKKLIGLAIFQTSALLLYISLGHVRGAMPPIVAENATAYANPLPQVLVLTAIVVGVATLAVGLAITVRIREEYGTTDEDSLPEEDES